MFRELNEIETALLRRARKSGTFKTNGKFRVRYDHDKNITICVVKIANGTQLTIKTGWAKYNPFDTQTNYKFDEFKGEKLSFQRAIGATI